MGLRYAVVALGCLACRTAGHGILVSPPPRLGTNIGDGNKLTGDAGNANCGGTDNGDPPPYASPKNDPKVAQAPGSNLVVSWSITIPHPEDNLNRGVRIALHYGDGDSFNNNILKDFGEVDAGDGSTLVTIPADKTCNNCVLQWIWDAVNDGGHYVQCVDMAITTTGLLPDPPVIATDNNNNGLPDGAAGAVVAVILILLILGALYYKRDSLPCLAGKGGSSKGGGGGGLPSGWTSAIDPASGKTYYTNSATGETTWDMPGGGGGGVAMGGVPAPPTSAPLPAGWKSAVDPASGKEYYVNDISGQTTWDHPGGRV